MPYLVAGAETVYGTFNKFRDKENIFHDLICDFMKQTEHGYLFSFGNGLASSKSKTKIKIKNSYAKHFGKFFKKDTFKKTNEIFGIENIVMDSGGYQAQSGYLTIGECYEFIDEYVSFIEKHQEDFKYFFALDLIPDGLSEDELMKMNENSFSKIAALSPEVRKKIIFIYHFFTPKVYKIWKTITEKYFDQFSDYFAFGGLAAKDTTSLSLPIAVFAIGIVQIVHNAKIRGINKLKIHVLGAASYRDIMLYQLYKAIIKEYHDVEIDITYDSSLVFKQIQKSRCINIIEKDFTNNLINLKQDILKTKKIYRKVDGVDTFNNADEILKEKINEMLYTINPKYLELGKSLNLYEEKEDGTGMALSKSFSLLSILFSGWQYNELEKRCYEHVMSKMPVLRSDPFLFYDHMSDILLKLNAGKLSYKFKDKIKYVRNTVECLIKLDTNYIDDIVNNFLTGAEIVDSGVSDVDIPLIDF